MSAKASFFVFRQSRFLEVSRGRRHPPRWECLSALNYWDLIGASRRSSRSRLLLSRWQDPAGLLRARHHSNVDLDPHIDSILSPGGSRY